MMAKLHIAKKELGLADDDYRAVMARVTGKTSSKDCSDGEIDRVLTEFKRLGFKPAKPYSAKPHVRKIYALWTALEKAGALSDASRKALASFCERQTGVTSPDWLTPPQANKVTEGLKSWLKRVEAGT